MFPRYTKSYARRSETSAGGQETLILGQRMWSIKNKLDTILQHLQKPSNFATYDFGDPVLEDASVCDPVAPPIISLPPPFSMLGPSSTSSKWLKVSFFDPATNPKGLVHKKVLPQKFINCPFSASNIIAEDFWNEYFYASP